MILEITFNNFRLFKNESKISYRADRRTRYLLSNSLEIDGASMLKAISLYGGNNSGKTNVFSFFKILKAVLRSETSFACNRYMFGDGETTDASITFNNMDGLGWLKYEFSYNSKEKTFPYEKLSRVNYYKTSTSMHVVFERSREEKRLAVPGLGEDLSTYLDVLPFDKPFLATVEVNDGFFSSMKKWKDALKRCSDFIEPIELYNIPLGHTIEFLKSGDEKKIDFVRSFVKAADLSITDIGYQDDLMLNTNGEIGEEALSKLKNAIEPLKVMTSYGQTKVPSLFFDSSGTKKIEAIASYVYDALTEGRLLVIDELDNGLHYSLTRAIVSLFNSMANKRGQLFFTAHDLMLIDCKNLFRKDQIYFVFREGMSATLLSIGNFKANSANVREGKSLVKRYNHGDFGYVPSPALVRNLISILGTN